MLYDRAYDVYTQKGLKVSKYPYPNGIRSNPLDDLLESLITNPPARTGVADGWPSPLPINWPENRVLSQGDPSDDVGPFLQAGSTTSVTP